ncbi:hypothetical protein HSB1_35650 [Halogranum salarium B-1]|uniref:Uncharacterized protein n=1 Tax=Halogranum salarium B-1 TaxID=1210908 RepID=J2ZYQ0_9EURY|nr:hypothetical protein HSB1_35650 [Halogranum salarium B-1]
MEGSYRASVGYTGYITAEQNSLGSAERYHTARDDCLGVLSRQRTGRSERTASSSSESFTITGKRPVFGFRYRV